MIHYISLIQQVFLDVYNIYSVGEEEKNLESKASLASVIPLPQPIIRE